MRLFLFKKLNTSSKDEIKRHLQHFTTIGGLKKWSQESYHQAITAIRCKRRAAWTGERETGGDCRDFNSCHFGQAGLARLMLRKRERKGGDFLLKILLFLLSFKSSPV